MRSSSLLEDLILAGYNCVPLIPGTKRPLVPWGAMRAEKASVRQMVQWFADFPAAEVGIITGPASGIMCLDFDAPPYSVNGIYTDTPSGGRHYFYEYHEGDRHAIGVRPKLDIPWLVKIYALPTLNPGRIPIQPEFRAASTRPQTQWQDATTPSFKALQNCAFVEWYLEKRLDTEWDGRYPLARAYASNASKCSNADLSLGPNYSHEEDIYARLPARPIRCAAIVEGGFDCPHFDQWMETCKKQSGVTTPYGLATKTTER